MTGFSDFSMNQRFAPNIIDSVVKQVQEQPIVNVNAPLPAVRKFRVISTFILSGATYYTLWESKLLEASCLCKFKCSSMPKHYMVNMHSALCGIYSFKLDAEIDSTYQTKLYPVTAFVKNYGFILELEKGYRSEYCEIESLFFDYQKYKEASLPPYTNPYIIKDVLEQRYRVPVTLVGLDHLKKS